MAKKQANCTSAILKTWSSPQQICVFGLYPVFPQQISSLSWKKGRIKLQFTRLCFDEATNHFQEWYHWRHYKQCRRLASTRRPEADSFANGPTTLSSCWPGGPTTWLGIKLVKGDRGVRVRTWPPNMFIVEYRLVNPMTIHVDLAVRVTVIQAVNESYVRKSTTAESGRIVIEAKLLHYQFFPQKPSLACWSAVGSRIIVYSASKDCFWSHLARATLIFMKATPREVPKMRLS